VEEVLKQDMYRYLHDQGVEFTIAPNSPQGAVDVVLALSAGARIYIEGKVFDNQKRNKDTIARGFGQTLEYLYQYNAASGYYIIYNTSDKRLVFDVSAGSLGVSSVESGGKTVHSLVIDIHDHAEQVSKRKTENVTLTREDLVREANTPPDQKTCAE